MSVIYALRHGNEIRYVGKTCGKPERRLRDHLLAARRNPRTPLHSWLKKHGKPVLVVLESDPPGSLDEAERAWIATLRGYGCRLLNMTPGGDGWPKGRPQSPESNTKRSQTQSGRKRPADLVERTAAAHRGRKRSPETCARISAAKTGRTHRGRDMAGERNSFFGRQHTDDAKRKIGEASQGRKHTPETRARIAQAMRARHAARRASLEITGQST